MDVLCVLNDQLERVVAEKRKYLELCRKWLSVRDDTTAYRVSTYGREAEQYRHIERALFDLAEDLGH